MFETFRAVRDSSSGAMFLRLLLLVALLIGVLVTLLVWRRGDHDPGASMVRAVRAPVMLPVAAPREPERLGPVLSEAQRRRWFRPLAPGTADLSFRPRQGVAPDELCARLGAIGWTRDRAPALGDAARDECAMTRVYARADGAPPTRLFAMARSARGAETTALDIRMKINLYDEAVAGEAGRDVAAALSALVGRTGAAPDADAISRIERFEPFETDINGAKLALKAERADIRRFNLTLLLPRPFESREPDRFYPVVRAPRPLVASSFGPFAAGAAAGAEPAEAR